ncbi:MAG TPA: DoxX family protein [Polyangia bacterium]|nr:DoxX family protein [Polyangia bacterium]
MRTLHKVVPTAARIFLGLVFTVFGLNFFLHFLPMPPAPPRAAAFAGALFGSGYFFPLLKSIEVVAGLLLLGGLFVPLALAVLAPIIVNIVGFHLFLAPGGLAVPLAVLAAELYLAWTYRAAFAPMLHLRTPLPQRPEHADAPTAIQLTA